MQRDRKYWVRLARFAAVAFVAALTLTPFFFGFLGMWFLTHGPCTDTGLTPAAYGYEYEDITIDSREAGGVHRGFYIPSQNGANIIFPPAFQGGRDGRLPEADILARHGYGVLTFESRSCMGRVNTLGYREVDDLAGALDWLLARSDVDPARIGVHGFSSAGATAIMAAAQLPELRAVLAEGGYHDLGPGTLGEGGSFVETLIRAGAELGYRLSTGVSIRDVSPVTVIDRIAPRPILLIYGSREVSLPGARAQLAAAGGSAALWVVEGAGHGAYLLVAPEEYERRVVEFFDEAFALQ
ncbi:MAG: prolyl oligopeptidase family serine peptidase [Anaerolineae bacterium]|nr:prolyl oligopeptidase family serine peptidase [Anaerolineae bacterium]